MISSNARPRAAFCVASSSRICAWMVTSSAVVGSSAISSAGSLASAIAIITRCRWPPESWCGKASSRCVGVGEAHLRPAASITRAQRGVRRSALVQAHRLGDLPADPVQRVEAGHRLLEDHARPCRRAAAQQLVVRRPITLLPVERIMRRCRSRPAAAAAAATARSATCPSRFRRPAPGSRRDPA